MATEVPPGTQVPQAPIPSMNGEAARANGGSRSEASNTQGAPQPPATPEAPPMPSVAEFSAGGEKERKVAIDEQARKNVRDRLEERIRIARFLEKEERPLTHVDRILLRSGDSVAANLESGNLTKEDAAVSYFALYDEAIQKFLASGKVAKLTITEGKVGEKRIWKLPKLPKLHQDVMGQVQEMQTAPLEPFQRQISEYTRKLGFETWSEARIDAELKSLTSLIHTVESSLLGLSPSDTLLDERLSTFSPLMLEGKTGNFLRDQVFDELMGQEGILTQRYEGKTFLELWNEDPKVALEALYEANQRALTTFAGEVGKEFLSKEKPKVDTNLIEDQAKKQEAKPTQEDIAQAQAKVDQATNEFNQAQVRLNELNAPIEEAERIYKEKQIALGDAQDKGGEEQRTRIASQIHKLESDAAVYSTVIQQKPDSNLPPQEKANWQQSVSATTQLLSDTRNRIQTYENQLSQMTQDITRATREEDATKKRIDAAQETARSNGLEAAKTKLNDKKTAKENAEIELENKHAVGETSPEAKEKAKALRKWNEVVGGYDKIVDARFSQKHTDEYSRERLADIEETADEKIKGAERIREHVFRLVLENKADYDPELARNMLSDEAIARAIIWVYKLDPKTVTNTDGKISIKLALPYLRSSQFQVGDLLRFMIHEGLKSAERGNPYLTLDKYFETPQPDLRLEAESIYRQGLGEVKMKDRQILWEGRLENALDPITFSATVPQHYSVGLGIDRNVANCNLYAKADREFSELLPDTFDPSLPDYVRVFYDDSERLAVDKPDLPAWIRVYDGASVTPEDALDSLNGMISAEFSQLMTSAIADYFLKRPMPERLQSLRGFRTVENINDVALAENPAELHNYKIRLDNNGSFWIQDITNPASPKESEELSSFFQKRLEDFKGAKFSLSQDERKLLQQEFLKILDPLGREILRAQQRR